MNNDTIKQLEHWISENPELKISCAPHLATLKQDNLTLDQFAGAIEDIELRYQASKLRYTYVQRKHIDAALAKLKTVKTYKTAGDAIKSVTSPVWDKALKPAASKTVVPAAAAVSGFFRGLFR